MKRIPQRLKKKKLIVFDLDGTLTPSKSNIRPDMISSLKKLLYKKKIAVIGGGSYKQFKKQFVDKLSLPAELAKNIFIFPASSTAFYRYQNNKWQKVYQENLSPKEKQKIVSALKKTLKRLGYTAPSKTYGRIIEDRGSQITFSALGQNAPLKAKEEWNKSHNQWRMNLAQSLSRLLPNFEVRAGGLTSVDITREGIDKAYGLSQIRKHLNTNKSDILFIGDAIYPGGNDYAVVRTGIDYLKVNGPAETKRIINFLAAD